MKNLILIRGWPGSGKSTLAYKILQEYGLSDDHLVEADHYWMVNGQYIWKRDHIALAHQWCISECFRRLQAYDLMIVANTFITKDQVWKYVEQAKKWGDIIVEIKYPQLCSVEKCFSRNVHGVPLETIQKMHDSFEPIDQSEVDSFLGFETEPDPVIMEGE